MTARRRQDLGIFGFALLIAAAVLFLSCSESNMITGEDLVVDGGFTIY